MPDPQHFDRMVDAYDRGRPPYPTPLWDHLRDLGVLAPGTRVLELAAGTGIATGPMIAAGATVTAVEPGPAMASVLHQRNPTADVRVISAERFEPDPASYDLAAIATAVHWLDLAVVLPMLHLALRSAAHLAVWHTSYGDEGVPLTPFRARVEEIVGRRPDGAQRNPDAREMHRWRAELEDGGLFRGVDSWSLRWTIDLDADRVRDLFASFSNWTTEEAEEAADAARSSGGVVTEHYVTEIEVLRREDRPRTGSPVD